MQHQLIIHFDTYSSSQELPESIQNLWQKAQEASLKAYAPYSNFSVGCAILLENGEIVMGANQENAAYPSGLCAERVALFHYGVMHIHSPIKAMAIVARNQTGNYTPASPCGGCRQVINEYAEKQKEPFEVFFQADTEFIYHFKSALDLLPIRFGAKNLF